MTRRAGRGWWRAQEGRVSAFVIVLLIGLLALAGLGLDGGLALAAKVRVSGQAESAARAGAQAVDLATYRATGELHLAARQAETLAHTYLRGIGASGTVTVAGDTVTVTVTTTYRTQLLGLIGIHTIGAHGTGSAHPQRGVSTPEP